MHTDMNYYYLSVMFWREKISKAMTSGSGGVLICYSAFCMGQIDRRLFFFEVFFRSRNRYWV